jgi:hypothetical protein
VQPDYTPDEQDILHSRTKTTGIMETEFDVGITHFKYAIARRASFAERLCWAHGVLNGAEWWTWEAREANAGSGCIASRT